MMELLKRSVGEAKGRKGDKGKRACAARRADRARGRDMAELAPTGASGTSRRPAEPEGASGRSPRAGAATRSASPAACSASRSTPRAACTTTCGSSSTACSSAGPCPRARASTPRTKRLAVHVEDHPLEYGDFEGTIPKGEYGGGTVMLWDTGTWEPLEGDPREGLEKGELKFRLDGERLHGGWVLVHTRRPPRRRGEPVAADQGARRRGAARRAGPVGPGRPQRLDGPHDGGDRRRREAAQDGRGRRAADGDQRAPRTRAPVSPLATLVEEPPEGDDVAARDQVRRLPHRRARRRRRRAPVLAQRLGLDRPVRGGRRRRSKTLPDRRHLARRRGGGVRRARRERLRRACSGTSRTGGRAT